MVHFGTVGYCILNSTLCPSVYPCFDVSIAMSGPQRRKYSRIKYADIQEGMTQRAANFDVNRWQSEWIFTRGELLDFECWVGRKSHCKGFILAEFSTYFSGAFPWKNGSITHPECTKTHCFEFEEAKLLWSFGLVRKAGVFIEFSWSFRGWDLEKTGFCFYKSFLFFGNYLYYIPENYIFVLKDSLDLSEFFIDNMMTSDVLHRIGPHHCRGCMVCDLRRFVDGDFCWKGL